MDSRADGGDRDRARPPSMTVKPCGRRRSGAGGVGGAGLLAAQGGDRDGGRGQHDDEADDADDQYVVITPVISTATPTAKTTPATIGAAPSGRRSEVPRRVEASLGSSSTRARSICSSSRSSSSESGTVLHWVVLGGRPVAGPAQV